jgi:hypothetical protein
MLSLDEGQMAIFFGNDMLYLPALYKDIFVDGLPVSGWRLTPAPYFFPDMPIYFLLHLFVPKFIYAGFLYAIFQNIFLLFTSLYLFNYISDGRVDHELIYIAYSFVIILSTVSDTFFQLLVYSFLPSTHFSAYILSLLLFYILLKTFKHENKYLLAVYALIIFLISVSDLLFVAVFLIPAFFSMMLYSYKLSFYKPVLKASAITFFGVGSALICYYYFFISGVLSPFPVDVNMSAMAGVNFLVNERMISYSYFVIIFLTFISIAATAIYAFNQKNENEKNKLFAYFMFSNLLSLMSVLAPLFILNFDSVFSLRYSNFAFYSSFFNLLLLAGESYKKVVFNNFVFPAMIVILFFISFFTSFNSIFFDYYPESARFIDSLSKKYNLNSGLADYTQSKYLTLFSKTGVKINQMLSASKLYLHINNYHWYLNASKNMKYNFVITGNGGYSKIDRSDFISRFGRPDSVITGNLEVLVYNSSEFDEKIKKFIRLSLTEFNKTLMSDIISL